MGGDDDLSNNIQSISNSLGTSNEQICTCALLDKSSRTVNDEFDLLLNNTKAPGTSYSILNYGISNIPTGIINNIHSNISNNLAIRNEVVGQKVNQDSSVDLSGISNDVEVTNSNLTQKEQIEDAVKKASKKYGVDANLIKAVIKTESNFNPTVVSKAGAKGLMQIMPSNFKNLGVTNPFDIYQNVDGGTKLLKEYIDKYNGDIQMALMAYNGGPTRMKNRGVTSIDHIYKMPKETQNYVKKVMKYYKGE